MSETIVHGADGKKKIAYQDDSGMSYTIDWDQTKDASLEGRHYRLWIDTDGHKRRVEYAPSDDNRIIEEVRRHVVMVNSTDDQKRIKKLEEQLLQKHKDDASLQDQKEGGGVIKYGIPKSGGKYETIGLLVDDLYDRAFNQNEREAQKTLDKYWKSTMEQLRYNNDLTMEITGCPHCNKGLERKQLYDNDGICIYCGEKVVEGRL